MNSARHLITICCLSVVMIALGTAGYMAVEGWDVLDALYMTIITVTTVGYSEVRSLSPLGRLYTICLIFSGFGFFVYVATAVVQFVVEGQVQTLLGRRRLDRQIRRLNGHYIICGYGRIGRVLCKKLRSRPLDLVVIEKDGEQIPVMEEDGVLYLHGDAANETLLMRAGIDRASGLVAALATDTDNVFLVLTARQLNADLKIIARAGHEGARVKLKAAGADRVESPYAMGAASMAQRILRPTVTSFLDLAFADRRKDIQMEEIPVSPASALANVMLRDSGIRQNYKLIIIAIKKSDGSMFFNPSFETVILPGETVIAVGEIANLQKLEKVLNPQGSARV
ncbi:potassium transporter TrkA [Desulfonema ishimotonii]|uniref:Potassium transporter TrkA n=1 Tax=Desulfonema ishimotonii TaxID=45657 RepID=A0A401G3A1_9BACT|nr:potassium channel protein [Desulfonema ishimotonii]GBC63710.1 potassium transporter TrkA [Desulfonema ishimotonii]